jgi:hypothetical protein
MNASPTETSQAQSSDRDMALLRRNIASRREYLRLYESAGSQHMVERDAQSMIQECIEAEKEALSRLAVLVRRLGHPMPTEERTDRLIRQLGARHGTLDRLEFLRRGMLAGAEWYEAQLNDVSASEAVRQLFGDLAVELRERAARIEKLANGMHV